MKRNYCILAILLATFGGDLIAQAEPVTYNVRYTGSEGVGTLVYDAALEPRDRIVELTWNFGSSWSPIVGGIDTTSANGVDEVVFDILGGEEIVTRYTTALVTGDYQQAIFCGVLNTDPFFCPVTGEPAYRITHASGVVLEGSALITRRQNEIQKLLRDTSDEQDKFGIAVATDGDWAIVGAPNLAPGGTDAVVPGSVHAYREISRGEWVFIQELLPNASTDGDRFGAAIAIDGQSMIVSDVRPAAESTFFFDFDEALGSWKQVARFPDRHLPVAISGDTAVAYKSGDLGGDNGSGTYVFKRIGGVWVQEGKLANSEIYKPGDHGVGVSGERIVLANFTGLVNGTNSGSAKVFERINENWELVATLTAVDPKDGDGFGNSVAIQGDTIIIGADGMDGRVEDAGAAFVFSRTEILNEIFWTQTARLTASDGGTAPPYQDGFGRSVGLHGDIAFVGAGGASGEVEPHAGATYVYQRSLGGEWHHIAKLTASDGQSGDHFGSPSAIGEQAVVVGAEQDGDNGWWTGSAYIFELDDIRQPIFYDVPKDHWAFPFVETLATSRITSGCGNDNYCPHDSVTRAQMAVFLERGIKGSDYVPPTATGSIFQDVGAGDFAADFIEQLFSDGITGGCGNGNYCPDSEITRDQMAVFLLRAKHGSSYSPPTAMGVFGDVDPGHWAGPWIEQLAAEGITAGCGNGNYCPDAEVTRDQMAVFLVRTFGLQ